MAIPSITEEFDTLYSTTWQLMREEAMDNIFNATPFWYYLNKNGRMRSETGGRWIGIQLEYATHSSAIDWFTRSHDLSTINTNADSELITTAQFDWKYLIGAVYRSYMDDTQNRGKSQMINIVDTKLNNVEKSLAAELEARLFARSGGGSEANEIVPLEELVAEDPTGAVDPGGIDESEETWWQNQYDDMIDDAVSVYLLPRMRTMFNDCSVGTDQPNLILTDQTAFESYEDEVLEFKQIVNESMGDASFETIKFKGRDMVWSPSCQVGSMYFLNLDYLEWVSDSDVNFAMTDWKEAKGDLDRVAQIITMGNLTCSNRRMQGVIFNIGEDTP